MFRYSASDFRRHPERRHAKRSTTQQKYKMKGRRWDFVLYGTSFWDWILYIKSHHGHKKNWLRVKRKVSCRMLNIESIRYCPASLAMCRRMEPKNDLFTLPVLCSIYNLDASDTLLGFHEYASRDNALESETESPSFHVYRYWRKTMIRSQSWSGSVNNSHIPLIFRHPKSKRRYSLRHLAVQATWSSCIRRLSSAREVDSYYFPHWNSYPSSGKWYRNALDTPPWYGNGFL